MNRPPATSVHSGQPNSNGRRGILFVLSAPSGAGKTTLRRAILERLPDLHYSVSYTTRPARTGEQAGKDYHFISVEQFRRGIERRRWAEWARVHGNYYGTSAEVIDRHLLGGRDVLLDIDVEGTLQMLERYPDTATIFIMPPSMEVLRERLEARGSDDPSAVAQRLRNAAREMEMKSSYRHVIVNDHLPVAIAELLHIIQRHRQGSMPKD